MAWLRHLVRRWLERDRIGLPVELGYVGEEKDPVMWLSRGQTQADLAAAERWLALVQKRGR